MRLSGRGIGLAVALTLGGCVVGPGGAPPPLPPEPGYAPTALPATIGVGANGDLQALVQGADTPGQWWRLYRSPTLDALVERALKANPDLASAQAALRGAQETYLAQKASAWPVVSASYNLTRQRMASSLASTLSSNQSLFTLHTAQVSVAYDPDVFGALRLQTRSARDLARVQRFQTEAAYLTLTSNLVAAAIQAAALQDQIAATRDLITVCRRSLDQQGQAFAAGEAARGDVLAQQALLDQAQASLPPLVRQLAIQRDLIAALSGGFPTQTPPADLGLDALALPADLPLSLPSALVRQRPDVRAAEAGLDAAAAQVGVAIANRLPDFALAADAGGAATELSRLLSNGDAFWLLAGTVTQPVFDAGALKHRQRAAEAALDQARAQYRSAVLLAFQNVADSLQALRDDADALTAAAGAQRTTAEALAVSRSAQAQGQANSLAALAAEAADDQARIALIQARAGRLADSAALYQALGGGWWNRSETGEIR